MRAASCGVASRLLPAQLRGTVRAVPACRGAALLPRVGGATMMRLGRSRVARLAASADAASPALPAPVRRRRRAAESGLEALEGGQAPTAETKVRRRRPHRAPGVIGETTPEGKPKPDERTVAHLVRRGVFASEEEAVAALTRVNNKHRFLYETAGPAIDWLLVCLADTPVVGNRSGVTRCVAKHPRVLTYSVDILRTGWATLVMAQEAGGLGYSPENAARRVCANAALLAHRPEQVQETADVLEECGVAVGLKAIAAQPFLLGFTRISLLQAATWWRCTGLDYKKVLTAYPSLLGMGGNQRKPARQLHAKLQAKLDFLHGVVGMSLDALSKAGVLFGLDLDGRMRPRYFYARLWGSKYSCTMTTLMLETDPSYVAYVLGRRNCRRVKATSEEVARYTERMRSPVFKAWCAALEARMKQRAARQNRADPALLLEL